MTFNIAGELADFALPVKLKSLDTMKRRSGEGSLWHPS